MQIETIKIPIEDVVLDERCQARADVDHDAVNEYAEAYKTGKTLPPPEVFRVSGKLYAVDGYHRIPAAFKAGIDFLRVAVVGDGTIDDAIWYATGVNQAHGVRRTNADKRRAVRMALNSPIGQEQSTAALAEHLGVSRPFVSKLREDWEAAQGATVAPSEPKRRKGKDGKSYPARKPKQALSDDTSGPEPDPDPLPHEPEETASPLPGYGHTLRVLAAHIGGLRREVVSQIPVELNGPRQRCEASLKAAEHALLTAVPIVCPGCDGDGCKHCDESGWTTKLTAKAG